ncbi:hypothetical protein JAO10_15405 [Burkholderia contaminans]|nr:hypothetical protein [Burkholderia contaminans]DAE46069.1 MAG TPA: hypothetical protein [Caudoviricetes sp.]MBH9667939.1 hypothetical protein [Burkholderia contaminans]MBH9678710.1 hypothetical protein [Burkholderia contaminans]MBH9705465.1 hypothetical protein [Burkholderia contaminans]MBH9721729.1 hypothetical protein [Burkholderia contaminans]
MDGFAGPFFTFVGGVAAALIANFLAEDFRRHRDGSALAAALAGELGSYEVPFSELTERINLLIHQAEAMDGDAEPRRIAEIELPHDPIYEAAASKIGLLGTVLPEKVVLAYGRIRAFRTLYGVIASGKGGVKAKELVWLYRQLLAAMNQAEKDGRPTVALLQARAAEELCPRLSGIRRCFRCYLCGRPKQGTPTH